MTIQSSILILDDGELENVHRMLLRLGANVVRLVGPRSGDREAREPTRRSLAQDG
jgi:hypothetical protein